MSSGPGGLQLHKELIQVATGFIGLLVALVGLWQVILTTQAKVPAATPTPLPPPATFVSIRGLGGAGTGDARDDRTVEAGQDMGGTRGATRVPSRRGGLDFRGITPPRCEGPTAVAC